MLCSGRAALTGRRGPGLLTCCLLSSPGRPQCSGDASEFTRPPSPLLPAQSLRINQSPSCEQRANKHMGTVCAWTGSGVSSPLSDVCGCGVCLIEGALRLVSQPASETRRVPRRLMRAGGGGRDAAGRSDKPGAPGLHSDSSSKGFLFSKSVSGVIEVLTHYGFPEDSENEDQRPSNIKSHRIAVCSEADEMISDAS